MHPLSTYKPCYMGTYEMWRKNSTTKPIPVAMAQELIDLIDKTTEVTGVSRSEFIRTSVIEKLERLSVVSTKAKQSIEKT